MDISKLPTNNMANAEPTRKMYSAIELEQPQVQETEGHEEGDLGLLRSKGVGRVNLDEL